MPRWGSTATVLKPSSRIVVAGAQIYDRSYTNSVERMDFQVIFPSWNMIGHFMVLRKLYEDGRETVDSSNETNNIIERLTSADLDVHLFRTIFVIPLLSSVEQMGSENIVSAGTGATNVDMHRRYQN